MKPFRFLLPILALSLTALPFGSVSLAAAADPTLGAHVLYAQNDTYGTDPAVTPPVTTQASGSTLLALSMGWLRNLSAPTDAYHNAWTQLSGPNTYFSSDFYTAVWSATSATGGAGHTLSFAKHAYPQGEISQALIEVKNGGKVSSVYQLAPGANQSPGSITVDGPATLIAVWGGSSWSLDNHATPDNGFTVFDAYLNFGNNGQTGVQVALASKQVSAAGTYTVNWTSDPVQDCACYLIAVQNATPPASNLILNPSLETAGTGGAPADWFRGGYGTNMRSLTYPVAGEAGARAAKAEITSYTDGDAKWYFKDVPVTAGETYAFSDYYESNVPSFVGGRYRMTDGTYVSSNALQFPASSSAWSRAQRSYTIPAGVVSMTVFHAVKQVGYVTTDDFSLTRVAPTSNLILNPSVETAGSGGAPSDWFRGGYGNNVRSLTYPATGQDGASAIRIDVTSYVDGDAKWYFKDVPVTPGQSYAFTDQYKANVPSTLGVRYKMTDGTYTYSSATPIAASASAWAQAQKTFTVPANVVSVTLFHAIKQVGFLTTDTFSLVHL